MGNKIEKPPVGLERLVMWPLTEDDETGEATYGTAHPFFKKLMSASPTPSIAEASLDADDQTIDHVVDKNGGELSIGLTALSGEDRTLLYGERKEGKVSISNKDDVSPYVGVAYMTPRRDGLVNLYKYPKVCFAPQGETYNTQKKGGIEYATTTIKGTYMPLLENGDDCYRALGVDPKEDAALITAWFTDGGAISADGGSEG